MSEALLVAIIVILLAFVVRPLHQAKGVSKAASANFEMLSEIAAQFRTDSGSSLRDLMNRLDDAAANNRAAAEDMRINVRILKSLADQAQVEMESLLKMAEASKTQYKSV